MIFKALSKSKYINIAKVIDNLNVFKTDYYKWLKKKPSNQYLNKQVILKKIKEIYYQSHMIYSAPKIHQVLINSGFKITLKTVANYMRELRFKAIYHRKPPIEIELFV